MKVTSGNYHTAQKLVSKITKVLTTLIVIAVLITGGVEALASQNKSYIYELGIINNSTNVVTTMRVRAKNEKDARDNVIANGWAVFSIKQLTYDVVEPTVIVINEGAGSVRSETTGMINQVHSLDAFAKFNENNSEIVQNIQPPDSAALTPSEISYIQRIINNNQTSMQTKREPTVYKTDNKVIVHNPTSTSVTIEVGGKIEIGDETQKKEGYHNYVLASLDDDMRVVKSRSVVDFNKNANESKKVVSGDKIYLDSEEVSLKTILYFHFSADEPILDKVIISNLSELPKDKEYVLVGYTDGAPVVLGSKYNSNYALSYARAESIAKILQLTGIKADMITIKGGGIYSQSVSADGSKVITSQRADSQKRRVEIYVK